PPSPLGPGEPSFVTQLRNWLSLRTNRPPVASVSYQTSCHLPSISIPIVVPFYLGRERRFPPSSGRSADHPPQRIVAPEEAVDDHHRDMPPDQRQAQPGQCSVDEIGRSGQPGHFLSSFRADHDAEQRDRPHIADQPQQPERWYDKHEDVHGGMPCSRSLLQALASIGPPPFPLRQRHGDADDDRSKQQHTD